MNSKRRSDVGLFETNPQRGNQTSILLGESPTSIELTQQINSIDLSEQPNSFAIGEQPNSLAIGEQPNSIAITESPNSITIQVSYLTYELFNSSRLGWNSLFSSEDISVAEAIRMTSDTNIGAIQPTKAITITSQSSLGSVDIYDGNATNSGLSLIPLSFALYRGSTETTSPTWSRQGNLTTFINSDGQIDEPLLWKDFSRLRVTISKTGGTVFRVPMFPWISPLRSLACTDFKEYNTTSRAREANPATFMYDLSFIPIVVEHYGDTSFSFKPYESFIDGTRIRPAVYTRFSSSLQTGEFIHNHAAGDHHSWSSPPPASVFFNNIEISPQRGYRIDGEINPKIIEENDHLYFGYPFKCLAVETNDEHFYTLKTNVISPPSPRNTPIRTNDVEGFTEMYNHASVGLMRNSIESIRREGESPIEPEDIVYAQKTVYRKGASNDFSYRIRLAQSLDIFFLESDESGRYIPVLVDNRSGDNIHLLPINSFHGYANVDNCLIDGIPVSIQVVSSSPSEYTVDVRTTNHRYILNVCELSTYGGYSYINDLVKNFTVLKIFKIVEGKIQGSPNELPNIAFSDRAHQTRTLYSKLSNAIGGKNVRATFVQDEELYDNNRKDIPVQFVATTIDSMSLADTQFTKKGGLLYSDGVGHISKGFTIPLIHPSISPNILRAEGAELRFSSDGRRTMRHNSDITMLRHYRAWIAPTTDPNRFFAYDRQAIPHCLHVIPSPATTENGNWMAIPPEVENIYGFDPSVSDLFVADKFLVDMNKTLVTHNQQLYLGANFAPMTPNLDRRVLPHTGTYFLLHNYVLCSTSSETYIYHVDEQTGIRELGSVSGTICSNPISTLGGSIVPIWHSNSLLFYGIQEDGLHVLKKVKVTGSKPDFYSHFINDGSAVVTMVTGEKEKHFVIDNQMGISLTERARGTTYIDVNELGTNRLIVFASDVFYDYQRQEITKNWGHIKSHLFKPPHREGYEFHTKSIILYFDSFDSFDKIGLFLSTESEEGWISSVKECKKRVVIDLPDRVIDSLRYEIVFFNSYEEIDPEDTLQVGSQTPLNFIDSLDSQLNKSILTRVELVGYNNQTTVGGNNA